MSEPAIAKRRPGRPRDARVDVAVIDAGGELLAEQGLAGFTVDAVAARAGVSKASIYRRWPSREALLFDVARERHGFPATEPVDTGSVRGDVLAFLDRLTHLIRTKSPITMLPATIAESFVNPALRDAYRPFLAERQRPLREALQRAIERGELPGDADIQLLVDATAGVVVIRWLTTQRLMTATQRERLVDTVLSGATARS